MGSKIYSKNFSSIDNLASDQQTIQIQEDFLLSELGFSKLENNSSSDIYFEVFVNERSLFDPSFLHLGNLKRNNGNGYAFPDAVKIGAKETVKITVKNNTGASLALMVSLHGKVKD